MAYISKEDIKTIREMIKKVMPVKMGFKFSIRNIDHNEVFVALMKSPFQIDKDHVHLNHYYPESYENENLGQLIEILNTITSNVKSYYNRNADDWGADYCNMTYYKSFNVGKWDKPVEIAVDENFSWETVKENLEKILPKKEELNSTQ
jgi:hypothetical protein